MHLPLQPSFFSLGLYATTTTTNNYFAENNLTSISCLRPGSIVIGTIFAAKVCSGILVKSEILPFPMHQLWLHSSKSGVLLIKERKMIFFFNLYCDNYIDCFPLPLGSHEISASNLWIHILVRAFIVGWLSRLSHIYVSLCLSTACRFYYNWQNTNNWKYYWIHRSYLSYIFQTNE